MRLSHSHAHAYFLTILTMRGFVSFSLANCKTIVYTTFTDNSPGQNIMKREILIYGLASGESRDYMEDLLACFNSGANDTLNIERVKAAASEAGYHSFRLAYYNGEKPNFEKAIQL